MRIIFKFCILILQILKKCNVVFLNETIENCQNYRIVKIYVHFFPGCFSITNHRIVFIFCILLLQMLKICYVVVLSDRIGNCQKYRILKMYEDLPHIRINVHLSRRCLENYSSGHFQIIYSDSADIKDVQRRSFDIKKAKIVNIIEF